MYGKIKRIPCTALHKSRPINSTRTTLNYLLETLVSCVDQCESYQTSSGSSPADALFWSFCVKKEAVGRDSNPCPSVHSHNVARFYQLS